MNDFHAIWNSRCRHGYAKRKNCPRCRQDASAAAKHAANTRWGNVSRPRRSVYEPRKEDH